MIFSVFNNDNELATSERTDLTVVLMTGIKEHGLIFDLGVCKIAVYILCD